MPVLIEHPTEFSSQDLADFEKIYADMPAQLLAPFDGPDALLQHAMQSNQLVVARFNGRLLGAALLLLEDTHWLLSHLCVRALTRERGVGKRLLAEVQRCAHEQQKKLTLSIPEQLTQTQHWAADNNYKYQLQL